MERDPLGQGPGESACRERGVWQGTAMTLVLELLAGAALSVALGLAAGALSATIYVIGLPPLAVGLGAGAGVAIAGLMRRGRPGPKSLAPAILAVLMGIVAFNWMDDGHFQRQHARDWATSSAVADGVEDLSLLSEEDLAMLARDAAPILDKEAIAQTGHGGFVGRWLLRAESGVRLLGPWSNSRGLDVGLAGALVWLALELVIAALLARAVLVRVARRSIGEGPDLDGEGEDQHQGT